MKQNRPVRSDRFVIFGSTALGFIIWIILICLICWVLNNIGFLVDFWAATEALSTAMAAAAVIGGGYVALRELKEQDICRHMQVADRLYEELNSKESIVARRWIFQNLPDNPSEGIPSLPSEGREAIKQVLNSLDRVAFLTQSGWIPEALIMPWMNPMIVKSWIKLQPFVDYEATRRHEPDYYEAVRKLALRCLAWRQENLPDAKITWVENAL